MKQPEVKASSFPGVLHYKECLKIYFKVPATLPKKSHYIQYSEKDTKLSHPMSIYGELSSSPHLCCAPREYFSSKFTGKKKSCTTYTNCTCFIFLKSQAASMVVTSSQTDDLSKFVHLIRIFKLISVHL